MDGKSSASLHENTHLVLKYAVISRLVLISLIVLWRSLLSPYDTSASINPSCLSNTTSIISLFSGSNSYSKSDSPPVLLPRLASAIEDSIVWDSVYFVRIAECGYEYEQTYAFLPLIPICISLLSRTVFAPLIPFMGQRAVLGLSGYMLNNFAFVLAAFYLYRLSTITLKDTEVALRASILFCLNPASIFYSSINLLSDGNYIFCTGYGGDCQHSSDYASDISCSESSNADIEHDNYSMGESSDLLQAQWERYMEHGENCEKKSELDTYLTDEVLKIKDFNILSWWKASSSRYPIMSRVARDVLSIPVCTVASESAFSTSGRILDTYRTSLSPKMVEALICTQQWIRSPTKDCKFEDILEEVYKIEQIEEE